MSVGSDRRSGALPGKVSRKAIYGLQQRQLTGRVGKHTDRGGQFIDTIEILAIGRETQMARAMSGGDRRGRNDVQVMIKQQYLIHAQIRHSQKTIRCGNDAVGMGLLLPGGMGTAAFQSDQFAIGQTNQTAGSIVGKEDLLSANRQVAACPCWTLYI